MLTFAIGFIQNVQLGCFAIVFILMALLDRSNRSLRWLAAAYCAGLLGGVFQFSSNFLPFWLWVPVSMIAAPVGYACIHAGIVTFLRRGLRTRWISVALVVGCLMAFTFWSLSLSKSFAAGMDRISTLQDFALAVQTALSSLILFRNGEAETRWPRRVMGTFLCSYSAVEFGRVGVYLATGVLPDRAAPWVEIASGIIYVISCSLLPMNFIWMQNARLHAHMGRQMTTDPLTQLLNRRGLKSAGELEVARYVRERRDFAVAVMDIDHFKHLNDTFGHPGGDQVLSEVAWLIRSLVRKSDTVGRLGGEEFVILLPGTPAAGAAKLVENLRLAVNQHAFSIDRREIGITASFGVTMSGGRKQLTWENLLIEADQALYLAKRDGRNLCRVHQSPIPADARTKSPEADSAWNAADGGTGMGEVTSS
jgi:diguanylate cyclase (GGDEF)-like protein